MEQVRNLPRRTQMMLLEEIANENVRKDRLSNETFVCTEIKEVVLGLLFMVGGCDILFLGNARIFLNELQLKTN